jgi:hypothetical protein
MERYMIAVSMQLDVPEEGERSLGDLVAVIAVLDATT